MKGIKAIWTEEKWETEEQRRIIARIGVEVMAKVIGRYVIYGWMRAILQSKKREERWGDYHVC